MDKEESLGKRLLKYLGATAYQHTDGRIIVYFPGYSASRYVWYFSWHSLLWLTGKEPARSLINVAKHGLSHIRGFKTTNPPFEYSSLDELELQLSARGF